MLLTSGLANLGVLVMVFVSPLGLAVVSELEFGVQAVNLECFV